MDHHKPWYWKGLRFRCTNCGACCASHGEYAHLYMMPSEVAAMAAHLELSEARFRARYCAEEEGWTVLAEGFPTCPFLGPKNRCEVYPVRPRQCRSWPFWQENLDARRWREEVVPTCPGIGQGPLHSADEIERIARDTEEWYEGERD